MANIGAISLSKGHIYNTAHEQSQVRAGQGYFAISGCDVHQASSPGMKVTVDAGTVQWGWSTSTKTVAGGDVTISAANATNPRIDIIYVDTNGAAQVYDGTAAAILPVPSETDYKKWSQPYPGASIPSGVILALVRVEANETTILNADVDDIATYGASTTHAPATTTSGKIPYWSATAKTLVDGYPTGANPTPFTVSGETESTDGTDGAADSFLMYDSSASANRKVLPNNLVKTQTRTIFLINGLPSITNGGAIGSGTEMATNKNTYRFMEFADGASDLSFEWSVPMPDSYDGGTVKATFIWTADSTSTNSVVWGIAGVSVANNESFDAAFGTQIKVTDAHNGVVYKNNTTALSSAITLAGTPAGGEMVQFKVSRVNTDGSDDLAVTALLVAVKIEYTPNSWSD
jgi:hypothetical protein